MFCNAKLAHTSITQHGVSQLPDLYATASSEALLSGRKPPYRLFVRPAKGSTPPNVAVTGAVSEPFVVATKRVRTAGGILVIDHLHLVHLIQCMIHSA